MVDHFNGQNDIHSCSVGTNVLLISPVTTCLCKLIVLSITQSMVNVNISKHYIVDL